MIFARDFLIKNIETGDQIRQPNRHALGLEPAFVVDQDGTVLCQRVTDHPGTLPNLSGSRMPSCGNGFRSLLQRRQLSIFSPGYRSDSMPWNSRRPATRSRSQPSLKSTQSAPKGRPCQDRGWPAPRNGPAASDAAATTLGIPQRRAKSAATWLAQRQSQVNLTGCQVSGTIPPGGI